MRFAGVYDVKLEYVCQMKKVCHGGYNRYI